MQNILISLSSARLSSHSAPELMLKRSISWGPRWPSAMSRATAMESRALCGKPQPALLMRLWLS